jgi:hypothetical protein
MTDFFSKTKIFDAVRVFLLWQIAILKEQKIFSFQRSKWLFQVDSTSVLYTRHRNALFQARNDQFDIENKNFICCHL